MDTAVELDFADGRYRFWLPMPQVIELERKCGQRDTDGVLRPKSIVTIFDGLNDSLGMQDEALVWIGGGSIHPFDVNEVLRLGLIGGGTVDGPIAARELVENYGYPARPLVEVAGLAWAVLSAAVLGISLKKKAVAAKPTKSSSRSTKDQ